ncbi:hypothetical protein DCAR_0934257 [Daucus carota subsp. sativus]|uniref:Uncharacterized protein n=1 Tax=Daucus carota subsp. sativus TaxID=79200 RepID=A0A175YEP6_DAUCS|nr:hypothetical protein DCAR_0934257 [Daucus carota subsp. sativus]
MTEWKNWRWFVDPRHNRVIEQLNRRLRDKNLKVRKRIVNASQNQLARYLAEDAVATKFSPVRSITYIILSMVFEFTVMFAGRTIFLLAGPFKGEPESNPGVPGQHRINPPLGQLESNVLPTTQTLHHRLGAGVGVERIRCRGVEKSTNYISRNSLETKFV